MKTLHPDVEILDSDEGYCCGCIGPKTVLTAVVHVLCAPSGVVAICVSCLEDFVSQ